MKQSNKSIIPATIVSGGRRALRCAAIVSVFAVGGVRVSIAATPLLGAPADPFLMYRVRDVSSPRFRAVPGVSLANEGGTGTWRVTRPTALAAPVTVDGVAATDTATHVTAYRIQSAAPPTARALVLQNRYGQFDVVASRVDTLLVPAAVHPSVPPSPLGANSVDRYLCHRARLALGQSPFLNVRGVAIASQFQTGTFDLARLRHVCLPVSANGSAIKNSSGAFLCYQARAKTSPALLRGVYDRNEFGPGRFDLVRSDEYCVPSRRPPVATGSVAIRGAFGHDSTSSRFDRLIATGFNVLDRGPFVEELNVLPPGAKALVWLGDYNNQLCAWEKSDAWIQSHVAAIARHPAIAGYFIADEPHIWQCPNAPNDMRTRSQLVKSIDPSARTVIVLESHAGSNPYAPYAGKVDIIAPDVYPCSHVNGCVMAKIDDAIALLNQAGITRYWPVIQAFGDSYYRLPSADELHEEFRRWRAAGLEGYLLFSWDFGTANLDNHPDIQQALKDENAR